MNRGGQLDGVLYFNVRSLHEKINVVRDLCFRKKPAIVIASEARVSVDKSTRCEFEQD